MPLSNTLSVGVVARRCGVKVSTLHFYEKKGLISSTRNHGNQRQYSRDVLRRVSLIKAAQNMGISLNRIKEAFARLPLDQSPSKKQWQSLAKQWQHELNMRIRYLENLRDNLTDCIGCGCLSMASCPLYNKDDKLSLKGSGPVLLDTKCTNKSRKSNSKQD